MNIFSPDLFFKICSKVNHKHYFEQLMKKQQKYFDIQPYKIDKFYSQSVQKLYQQIHFKYQITKQLLPHPNFWHQNQRKIFTWFVVCYFHEIGAHNPLEVDINWDDYSQTFFGKSSSLLKFQFLNIVKIKKRVLWTNQQDNLLMKAGELEGVGRWNQISKSIFFDTNGVVFKNPKHCRQRWLNHLDEKTNKGVWTEEEDYKIFSFVKQNGRKWSKIVRALNNTRTQHMVKNRFNSLMIKNRKNKRQKQTETIDRILSALQRTVSVCSQNVNVCSQPQGKRQDFHRINQVQIQSDQQGENNVGLKGKNKLDQKTKRQKFVIKKSSFELTSSQYVPLLNIFTFPNIFQRNSSGSYLSSQIKNSESMILHQMVPNYRSQKSQTTNIYQTSQNIKQTAIGHQGSNQIVPVKTKPVYIIRHNF